MTINSLEDPLKTTHKTHKITHDADISIDTEVDKIISLIFGPGLGLGLGLGLKQNNIYKKITDPVIITNLRSKHKLYEGSLEYLKLEFKLISLKNEYHLNPFIHLQYVTDNLQYVCLSLYKKEKIYFYYEILCKDFYDKEEIREISEEIDKEGGCHIFSICH